MPLQLSSLDKYIQDQYSLHRNQGIDAFPATITKLFKDQFTDEGGIIDEVPVLDLHKSEYGTLVKFNGMIQDTSLSPELYVAKTPQGECGGWGLKVDADANQVDHSDLRECSVFWVVSIPGSSSWCSPRNDAVPNSSNQPHKYPVPNALHVGLQIKIYDEALAQPLRTTDLLSMAGFLTSEPLHSSIDLAETFDVPTFHVVFLLSLPTTIIPRKYPSASLIPTIKTLREELIQWVADEALAGDTIAAEWITLSIFSRVRSRNPPILPLCLTLSDVPSPSDLSATPALQHVLSLIYPLVTTLPLSLETLNNTSACPESKEEDLHSGWLQHPKGSILILTEGGVKEGGIFNKGVMNIRATQEMMKTQTLDYVFPFSGFQFETDVNFLVLSEGKQSTLFKTDLNIPLRPSGSVTDAEKSLYKPVSDIKLPSEDKLEQFRMLVGGAKVGNVAISEATGKHIEDEFVKERANADKSPKTPGFTPDDLIQRMLIARMYALSYHQEEITIDSWEHAKDLETRTKAR